MDDRAETEELAVQQQGDGKDTRFSVASLDDGDDEDEDASGDDYKEDEHDIVVKRGKGPKRVS